MGFGLNVIVEVPKAEVPTSDLSNRVGPFVKTNSLKSIYPDFLYYWVAQAQQDTKTAPSTAPATPSISSGSSDSSEGNLLNSILKKVIYPLRLNCRHSLSQNYPSNYKEAKESHSKLKPRQVKNSPSRFPSMG